jgi:bifunctional DNA-binding transcriptional regulator/antitoxin component of YhaV-PrlF toxin-antitoxin module
LLDGGRLILPADFRRAMNLEPGDTVVLALNETGELRVRPRQGAIARARAILAAHLRGQPSMADELIAERRAEAAHG